MKRYKLHILYDGTDFAGWIYQPDEPTIVQSLERAFYRVFKKKIQILGASKTDAGVHALGQVAIFSTDLEIDADKIRWAWNKALPESIRIDSLKHDQDFHPHYGVEEKTYWYHISRDKVSPFFARYCWYYPMPFDEEVLKNALQLFIGTHDFEHFYKGDDRKDTMRTINEINVHFMPEYNAYRIEVKGEKFLRHMVRRMVGSALHAASGKIRLQEIADALAKNPGSYILPTAPAHGLMLKAISYHEDQE